VNHPRITFIGGGSAKFVRELAVDFFSFEALRQSHIVLMDIDADRVERSRKIVQKIIDDRKLPAKVSATLNQREALEGADYVIITIMVGGLKHYNSDSQIPAKYGVYQTVGDTTGAGGVFRYLRTAPVLRGIVEDLKRVSPDAWILNYANPMSMNTWTLKQCGHEKSIGLCHSIQYCLAQIAGWLNIPKNEIHYTAGGINHIDFYLKLEHRGEDLYPKLLAAADRVLEKEPHERTRFELLKYLGHFPAECAWHQSEYYGWFRKNQAEIDRLKVESFWGYKVDSWHMEHRAKEIDAQLAGTSPIVYERSAEYGSEIVHALEGHQTMTFYGNTLNHGLIENLPYESLVEVPCTAEKNGIFASKVGKIPTQLAAVMTPHIFLHEMAVRAALTGDRKLARMAVQADPLVQAILTLPQIERMVDELFVENEAYLKAMK
jgi:alpha-galactosidase